MVELHQLTEFPSNLIFCKDFNKKRYFRFHFWTGNIFLLNSELQVFFLFISIWQCWDLALVRSINTMIC